MKGGNFHGSKCICNITRKAVLNPGNSIAFSLSCPALISYSSLLFPLALHLFGAKMSQRLFHHILSVTSGFLPPSWVSSENRNFALAHHHHLHLTNPIFSSSFFSGYITTCCKVFRLLLMVYKKLLKSLTFFQNKVMVAQRYRNFETFCT